VSIDLISLNPGAAQAVTPTILTGPVHGGASACATEFARQGVVETLSLSSEDRPAASPFREFFNPFDFFRVSRSGATALDVKSKSSASAREETVIHFMVPMPLQMVLALARTSSISYGIRTYMRSMKAAFRALASATRSRHSMTSIVPLNLPAKSIQRPRPSAVVRQVEVCVSRFPTMSATT
jgi:hypothetical protein